MSGNLRQQGWEGPQFQWLDVTSPQKLHNSSSRLQKQNPGFSAAQAFPYRLPPGTRPGGGPAGAVHPPGHTSGLSWTSPAPSGPKTLGEPGA